MKKRVAVIGAGISGLICAYELQKLGHEVQLFEKENSIGGRMATRVSDGFSFDIGANFFVKHYRNMERFHKELGIEECWKPVKANEMCSFRDGRLHPISILPKKILTHMTQISFFSRLRLIWMLIKESRKGKNLDFFDLTDSARYDNGSAYDYAVKHAGKEVAEFLIDPFISTYQFHRSNEISYGCLRAFCAEMFNHSDEYIMYHSRGELMSALPNALAKKLQIKTGTAIKSVLAENSSIQIDGSTYDAAVLACTASAAEKIYQNPSPAQKEFLPKVKYAATIMLAFRMPATLLQKVTLVMVPFAEGGKIAEYTNEKGKGDSCLQGDKTLLLVALHESFARKILNKSDEEIFSLVREELPHVCPELQGQMDTLENHDLQRWPEAMPKFAPGHLRNVEQFLRKGQGEQNVFFCGDYLNSPWTEGSIGCGERVAQDVHCALAQKKNKPLTVSS